MDEKIDSLVHHPTTETKQSIREQIWDIMSKEKLSPFPGPFGRIPNFKGAQEAAQQLLELSEFQNAKAVEVNPDKPLEAARALVLSNKKDLYVPTPQLRGSLLKKLEKPTKQSLNKKIVTQWGINFLGKDVNLDHKFKIDMIIVGCVAVSKDGYRIGKGKGFADLEFAVLKEMGFVNDDTTIVAIVHDIQIFDKLDPELFNVYDVPVNYILTPTNIIKAKLDLPRPKGIYWDLITLQMVNDIEILQQLKAKHESEGLTVHLKVASNEESENKYSLNNRKNVRNNYRKNNLLNYRTVSDTTLEENKYIRKEQTEKENIETISQIKQSSSQRSFSGRTYYRKKDHSKDGPSTSFESSDTISQTHTKKEDIENVPPPNKQKKKHNGYSLIVSNIHKDVRIQKLKNVLIEKGIKPSFITWRGFRGFCLLHYSKKNIQKDENGEAVPLAIDNVIELIQDISINPDPSQKLTVKVKEPITRIETLDVTSV